MNDSYFLISGGKPLQGTVRVSGAKNAALKMIVASLIADGISILSNVPKILDVEITLKICESLGSKYQWLTGDTLQIDNSQVNNHIIPVEYSGGVRTPILFVSPLLHRLGRAEVTTIGGCSIGPRPINYHIEGLKSLGANVDCNIKGKYVFSTKRLEGNVIKLEYPSVGATENLIMAAVGAQGRTVIQNAAIEPEIANLVGFLQAMGAVIYQDVNRSWIIDGVSHFRSVNYPVMYDRIEAASFAVCGIATKGDIFIHGAEQQNMITFLNLLRKTGGMFDIETNGIRFYYDKPLRPVVFETDVHPGFMTDWQPPFCVLLTQAQGISVVHETVYEKRFEFVDSLKKMGADIQLHSDCLGNRFCRFANKNYKHSAIIAGPSQLNPQEMSIPDLRAGFSYIMAALLSDGESKISGTEYVKRGYCNLASKLQSLGAQILEI